MKLWRRLDEPVWEVVGRHFEEAEFLAGCWRDALDEPDITLDELAGGIESRLLRHLDALAVTGAPALERYFWPALLDEDADVSLALVAGLGVLARGSAEDCWRLVALLDELDVDHLSWIGIVEALALSDRSGVQEWLCACLDRANEGPRVAGVVAALARRRAQLGPGLTPLLQSSDPNVLRFAAVLARGGEPSQLSMLAKLGQHADPLVVASTIETALVRGLPGAVETARYWAFDGPKGALQSTARAWLGVLGLADDERRLLALLADSDQRRDALWALSYFGSVAAVEASLPLLGDDDLGPFAAEVVTAIAGLPTETESLWLDRVHADDEIPALSDDELDASLELRPEDLLPVPNPDAIMAWWRDHCQKFDCSARWLSGEVLNDETLASALVHQPMRRRHALCLLAEIRRGAATGLATSVWAHVQLRALTGERSL